MEARTGGFTSGLEANKSNPVDCVITHYYATDTKRIWRWLDGEWSALPRTFFVATAAQMNALINKREGDWCYVSDTHRYNFWDGSAWRQVRF